MLDRLVGLRATADWYSQRADEDYDHAKEDYSEPNDVVRVNGPVEDFLLEDKEGNKRSKLLVIADSVQFLGGKQDGERQPQPQAPAAPAPSDLDDEPPF